MWQKIKALVKTYYKPFLLIFIIYLVAFFTLYRDQYFFTDDTPRSVDGYDYIGDFNRFSSNIVVHTVQMTLGNLVAIAPIGQIIAMAVLAISSLLLVSLFSDKKPSLKRPVPLILSTLLGLTPFMLNAWQYQFESTWFSTAIFMAILPYALYWGKTPSFKLVFSNSGRQTPRLHIDEYLALFSKILFVTIACNIFVWTSWQVATGIFLSLGLAMIFKSIINRQKLPWSDIITFILAYIVATIFAYITTLGMSSYVDTSIFPLQEMIPGLIRNLIYALRIVADSLNRTWIFLGIASLVCLFILNRTRNYFLAVIYFVLAFPISIGPCLALQIFHIDARSLVGPVLSFTIFVLMLIPTQFSQRNIKLFAKLNPKMLLTPLFCLLYSFAVCAWSYGNALTDQYRYEEFRISTLESDLAHLYPTESLDEYLVDLYGNVGLSAMMVNHFYVFPVASFTFFQFSSGLSDNLLSLTRMSRYFGREQNSLVYGADPNYAYHVKLDCDDTTKYQPVLDTYYYTILDNRNADNSEIVPIDDLRDAGVDLTGITEDGYFLHNLHNRKFGVCVILKEDAKPSGNKNITYYRGQLVKDKFYPYDSPEEEDVTEN